MESVDFHEMFSGFVECPVCGETIDLKDCVVPYKTGDKVVCIYCGHEFILGESL